MGKKLLAYDIGKNAGYDYKDVINFATELEREGFEVPILKDGIKIGVKYRRDVYHKDAPKKLLGIIISEENIFIVNPNGNAPTNLVSKLTKIAENFN